MNQTDALTHCSTADGDVDEQWLSRDKKRHFDSAHWLSWHLNMIKGGVKCLTMQNTDVEIQKVSLN